MADDNNLPTDSKLMSALVNIFGPRPYGNEEAAIEAAISIGHRLHVRRQSPRYGSMESAGKSLAREMELVFADHYDPAWLWGRESWMTRRRAGPDLIAWTVDRNGRIVRGWRRNKLDRTAGGAYHPWGDRFCPCEAAWLPLVVPGRISFPAYPFLCVETGRTDPGVPGDLAQAAATVERLKALRLQQRGGQR
jgi:hypothetical protein